MSSIRSLLNLFIVPVSLFLFTGCGITGGTSAKKVALNPAISGATLSRSVQIGAVSARAGAGVNKAIGAYNLGKFDESDLITLRESVRRSIPSGNPASASVHIIVQHFALTFTNNGGANLAIIDWCTADGSHILASERFYAAYYTGNKLIGTETLGMAKSRLLHAAAARIAERSLAAANNLPMPPGPPLTFDDPEPANATMPKTMSAAGAPGLAAVFVQQTMLGGLDDAVRLLPDSPIPPVDWSKQL
ncbi:hypothetical protein [Rariglobus hedericola]|uniref:Lipoprotein n=1 Tax=Rariglobus hedericola TaxID=2597822 RepID=A0A556QP17_9BACT|nr:hypothetical protein [Rariglobus hedericola]TSJ78342.1 hypothetical protein FPL22_03290 [Rariglobus hedericola]